MKWGVAQLYRGICGDEIILVVVWEDAFFSRYHELFHEYRCMDYAGIYLQGYAGVVDHYCCPYIAIDQSKSCFDFAFHAYD